MDEVYRARLTSTPHPPHHSGPEQDPRVSFIPQTLPGGLNPPPGPIPIQLPNIYVNPFPNRPPSPSPPHIHAPAPAPMPANAPMKPAKATKEVSEVKKRWWEYSRPHPLLWISLAISLLALILEVPKGSLPTITRRHATLRVSPQLLPCLCLQCWGDTKRQKHEKQVQERLQLLSKLSTFLPPPLASMVMHLDGQTKLNEASLALFTPDALKFWNAHGAVGSGKEGSWWSVEDLGIGAQVVRSRGDAGDREIWVVATGSEQGEDKDSTKPLLNALTHSLLLRDRLLAELTTLKTADGAVSHCGGSHSNKQMAISGHTDVQAHSHSHSHSVSACSKVNTEEKRKERMEDWERQEERRRREKERERDLEEREIEVSRREKWVIEEIRKLTDKVHSQATELTLEDRITERMKAYQRQLAHLNHEHEHGHAHANGA